MQNDEFIILLKSVIKENRLDIILDNDLIVIYDRLKSIDASNSNPDIELSKVINTLSDEIKKRKFSSDVKPQEKSSYEESSFAKEEKKSMARVPLAIIVAVAIVLALLVLNEIRSNPSNQKTQSNVTKFDDGFIPLAQSQNNKLDDGSVSLLQSEEKKKSSLSDGSISLLNKPKNSQLDDGFVSVIQPPKRQLSDGFVSVLNNDEEKPKELSFSEKLKEMSFPFRFTEESINGIMYRYDRFTRKVERKYRDTWKPQPRFKNLQQVRDFMARVERNRMISAMEEQTEASERLHRQQQLKELNIEHDRTLDTINMDHDIIMNKYEEDKLRRDVEDIKETLDKERRDRQFREMNR